MSCKNPKKWDGLSNGGKAFTVGRLNGIDCGVGTVDEYDVRDPAHSPSERVLITLADGRTMHTGPIVSIRGHADDPLGTEELWQKFKDCTVNTHTPSEAHELFEKTQSLVDLGSTFESPTCVAQHRGSRRVVFDKPVRRSTGGSYNVLLFPGATRCH